MHCRIGITTDPAARKQEWLRRFPFLRNWTILSKHDTKTDAQAAGQAAALLGGCTAYPGGPGPGRALWYVYYFEH